MLDSLPQQAIIKTDVPSNQRRASVIFWSVALLLTAVIVGLLWWNNREYFFHTPLYEAGDFASNSLFVREAKQGGLIHGHYSRWKFYHPGPVFLDTLALGEAVFYNGLHWAPTPLNGQLLALCAALTAFFSVGITIFARRLGPERGGYLFFLPLALLFAVFHYSRVTEGVAFMDGWPPSPLILAFLCFLVSAASTVSGGGWDLPVLVLTSGWLVHLHVAQPLFVVPITLLAYLGLLASCRRLTNESAPNRDGWAAALSAGWRRFPAAHWVALVFLALLVLPLLIDAAQGRQSNLNRILTHMHDHAHVPSKKFLRSLCYFLTFGGYDSYVTSDMEFGRYSAAGMFAYIRAHWLPYACWTGMLLAAPMLFFVGRRRAAAIAATASLPRNAFISWFYVIFVAAVALTLKWGMMQDGPMFYFNSYFNHSIYFCVALGFAAALSSLLMVGTSAAARRSWRPIFALLLWLGVAGAAFGRRDCFQFKEHPYGKEEDRLMARTTDEAAARLPQGSVCFLEDSQPGKNWSVMAAMVLELERKGHRAFVNDNWEIMFGERRCSSRIDLRAPLPIAKWVIKPLGEDPARLSRTPLGEGLALDWKAILPLDPAGQRIDFAKKGNYQDYAVFGWAPADGDWTWSDQRTALLEFLPQPLPDGAKLGVDMLITAWPFMAPGSHDAHRLEIRLNGEVLPTVKLPAPDANPPAVRVRIDAERWRRAVAKGIAQLAFGFPDATSPKSVQAGSDDRLLGGAFQRIEFRPASDEAAP